MSKKLLTTEDLPKPIPILVLSRIALQLKEMNAEFEIKADGIIIKSRKKDDERIRKELIKVFSNREKYLIDQSFGDITVSEALAWLKKQGDCSAKWEKNTADNKPTLNHSVLMKNIHGIAEGEWNGKEWIQYRWSSNIKDSDVLYWMNLYELEKQGKQKQEWSKEDENRFQNIIACIEDCYNEKDAQDLIRWFKSLRHQPKQVWSKEDETAVAKAITSTINKSIEWLKDNIHYDDFGGNMEWYVPFADDECMIQHFKIYMEE